MSFRWRQVLAILRLEVSKNLWAKRAIPVVLLALSPAILMAARALLPLPRRQLHNMAFAGMIYAGLFQVFFIRLAVFFGCVVVFTSLFRGEVLEKTLHYYFLAPLRRETLVIAKYLSGLLITVALFTTSTVASFILLYVPYGAPAAEGFFFDGPGLQHLAAYAGVTALACLGYGAVFLAMGLLFRNPMIPAALVLGWESINFLLPPMLKKLSVIHYLLSLCPVPFPEGPFAFLAEPTPAWISIPGLIALTAAVLVIAGLRIRRLEISYETE